MTQDELKKAVGWAALQYVQPGTIVGVGTVLDGGPFY